MGDYNNGTAYKNGDVVRLGGFTYICIEDSTGNRPPNVTYWDKLNEGIYWKGNWANATLYDKGDVVRGIINTNNSYICILARQAPILFRKACRVIPNPAKQKPVNTPSA